MSVVNGILQCYYHLCIINSLTASVSSKKIKCYYCQYQYSKLNSKAPINKNCLDRVDDDDIEKIECEGTCYVSRIFRKDICMKF